MNETAPFADLDVGCACCGGGRHEAAFAAAPGRRRLLRAGLGAMAAASAAAAAVGTGLPRRAAAQSTLSPDAALQALLAGNKRFYEHRLTAFDEDLAVLKERTLNKQEPFAGILSCADSRVPVELLFDQSIGQLFVTRVAGNTAGSTVTASLEYGAAVLGTKIILVLGHARCGAVKAAMSGKPVPGQISRLFAALQPAVEAGHGNLEDAIKANAVIQAKLLTTGSPLLGGLVKSGDLKIVAGYYALDTGVVTLLS